MNIFILLGDGQFFLRSEIVNNLNYSCAIWDQVVSDTDEPTVTQK
jgi:hypothetical protein